MVSINKYIFVPAGMCGTGVNKIVQVAASHERREAPDLLPKTLPAPAAATAAAATAIVAQIAPNGIFQACTACTACREKEASWQAKKKNLVLEDQTVMLAHAEQIRLEQLSS